MEIEKVVVLPEEQESYLKDIDARKDLDEIKGKIGYAELPSGVPDIISGICESIELSNLSRGDIESLSKTLGKKIESNKTEADKAIDSLRYDKIEKGTQSVDISDLSNEVKQMMTGGSVAVVGENSVGTKELIDKSVTADKVDFLDAIISTNILGLNDFSKTALGLTIKISEGILVLDGSSTENIYFRFTGEPKTALNIDELYGSTIAEIENGRTYSFKVHHLGGTASVEDAQILDMFAIKDTAKTTIIKNNSAGVTVSTTADMGFMFINKGVVFNNYKIGIMLERKASPSGLFSKVGEILSAKFSDIILPLGTRKTENIPYELIRKTVDGNGGYSDSTTALAVKNKLQVVVGDRYRFTVNDGYCFVFHYKVNGTGENIVYHTRMMEAVFYEESVPVVIKRVDGGQMTLSENIGLKIEHILQRNKTGIYDCVVAANDSSAEDKEIADIICDGVNDEVEIECAVNCNITKGDNARVLLLPGKYNIDNFHKCMNGLSEGRGYNAIQVNKSIFSRRMYSVWLEGRYKEYSPESSSVRIEVSESCYNSLLSDKEYSLIGALRIGDANMGNAFNIFNLDIKNLFISPYGMGKPICCVDGAGFSCMSAENIQISPKEYSGFYFDQITPVKGLIGIRGVCGSNRGIGNYIKNCKTVGMYEGLAITGEHFIVQDCLEHHCVYGFSVGNYPVRTRMEHPNVFIGNSVEQCLNFGLLNEYGSETESTTDTPMQTLIYIGGSTECTVFFSDGTNRQMKGLKEIVKGRYRGRVETDYDINTRMYVDDGSCSGLILTNTDLLKRGTTAQRPSAYLLQDGTEYFDTTIGKKIYSVGGNWVE